VPGTTAAPAALRSLLGLRREALSRAVWNSALGERLGLPDLGLNITERRRAVSHRVGYFHERQNFRKQKRNGLAWIFFLFSLVFGG